MITSTSSETFDLYRWGASIAFEVPLEEVTPLQRGIFKEHCVLINYDPTTTKENIRARIRAAAEQMRRQRKELQ